MPAAQIIERMRSDRKKQGQVLDGDVEELCCIRVLVTVQDLDSDFADAGLTAPVMPANRNVLKARAEHVPSAVARLFDASVNTVL